MSEFSVGENVVYPPHGAGTVVSRAPRTDGDGELLSILIAHSKMTLMVPADIAEEKGVRQVMSKKDADGILKLIGEAGEQLPDNPQHRARFTKDKTRIGSPLALAEVIRDYVSRQRDGKKLSPAEMTMLNSAKQLLSSELVLVRGVDPDAALALIDDAIEAAIEAANN